MTGSTQGGYDVVICGTDLIQSILSSALSRAGKKVLHCDGNEWYGGLDTVMHGGSTLDSFIERCLNHAMPQEERDTGRNAIEDKKGLLKLLPREKYGSLRLHSQSFVRPVDEDVDIVPPGAGLLNSSIDDNSSKRQREESPNDSSGESKCAAKEPSNANEAISMQQPPSIPLEHGFCFDLTPSLLYASGDAVENIVKSGVADYLEFKSLKGTFLIIEEEKSSAPRNGRRRQTSKNKSSHESDGKCGKAGNSGAKKLASYRVPCSKGDVFQSELLSPVDKRRLMKFLQLITDYGMATQLGDGPPSNALLDEAKKPDEDTPNDSDAVMAEPGDSSGQDAIQSINERHLHRGRALSRPQNKATPSSSDMEGLMRCVRDDVSFSYFLAHVAKLPERLSTVVVYALALAPGSADGTNQMNQYSTKNGVDDLLRHVTALGRFGDTAFLVPMYGSGELSQAFCRSGAVYGSTYMLRRSPAAISLDVDGNVQGLLLSGEEHIGGLDEVDTDDVSDRSVSCKHVIIPGTMLDTSSQGTDTLQTRTYRRISILQGKLVKPDRNDDKRGSDNEQRYAFIIPPNTDGLGNTSAIHGLAVDDSAFIAPRGKDYTVLHLTTNSDGDEIIQDELFVDILRKAVDLVIACQPRKEEGPPLEEWRHISFSHSERRSDPGQPSHGLHVCYRGDQFTCDSAFREAKRVFEDICPESDFLAIAKKVEEAIVYRDEQDSDDEKMVLESACNMIQAPCADDNSAHGDNAQTR
ncbi:hypothetical protein ACHAWF_005789 [Thalassiosira exigua]